MMSAVEGFGHGHGLSPIHGGGFPGKGLHLGHMRGTAEGPPGLRPDQAETPDFVEGAAKGAAAWKAEGRNIANAAWALTGLEADGGGRDGRPAVLDTSDHGLRDRLAAWLTGINGGGGGDNDDSVDDVAVLPPAGDDGDGDAGADAVTVDGTGGTAAPPAADTGGVAAAPEVETGGVAAPPAPEVVESGDPVFDLTLSGVIGNIADSAGTDAVLALLEASQGYSEAAEAA